MNVNLTGKRASCKLVIAVFFCAFGFCSPNAHATPQRGRPYLNAARTTFVGDNGQDLRGPFTSTEWTGPVPAQNIANIRNLGFNAVHLYAEDFNTNYPASGTAPGYSAANVDAIVAATQTNGLYLIITIGNGAYNGSYNAAYITNFWKFYAARYANETHVLFEIQNEPVAWGPPYSSTNATPPGAINMEINAYKVIRQYAPNTPVLLFSYSVFGGTGGTSAALTDIHAFNTAVFGNANTVWTNEAVAFHGYAGWAQATIAASGLLSAGYPCVMTEAYGTPWGAGLDTLDAEFTSELETLGISWLTFQYIPPTGVATDVTQPQYYSNIVVNAGLSWTPDYGTFPPARGPYGNGGQPWSVPASYANNFLTGTPLLLQAENFDAGGEGVAYHELTTTNLGGQYRTNEAVDIEVTSDTGGGYDVTGTAAGEWLEYTIWVPVPGYYNLSLRYASPTNGAAVQVTGNGNNRTGAWYLPGTGSATTWATATQPVLLETGRQKVRLNILNGGFGLNWLQLTPSPTGLVPNGTYGLLNAASTLAFTGLAANGTVSATNYTGSTYQQWNLQHIGGNQYKITAAANGWSWNLNNGALGFVSGWGAGSGQCFVVAPVSGGFYRILPVSNGEPLETSATNQNTIDQQVYSGSASQLWALAAPAAPVFPTGLTATALSVTQASLAWNAVPGATSYNVKRALASGGPYATVATGLTTTNYTDTVPAGMRFYYVITAVAGGSESPASLAATVSLPSPWLTEDIGAVGVTGGASASNGVFSVTGAGADIWGTADAFRFASLPVSGNGTVIARVTSVPAIDPWSKAGVMVRGSLAASAVNAFMAVTPGNGVTWQYRSSNGGNSSNLATPGLTAPYWVKLVRAGNTFTGYSSPDGVTWSQLGTATFTMASTAYVGLAVTSHNSASLCAATFDNVAVPGWSNASPPPAPASLATVPGNGNVLLTWTASGTATSYNVKRAVTYGGPYSLLANLTTTSYTDTGLVSGTNYYYVVSALSPAGESANSTQASVTGQVIAPAGLSAAALSATQVNLVWNALTNATSYNVKRSPASGGPYATLATGVATTNYTDTVPAGMEYYYAVSAIYGGVETPNSPEATVNPPYPWLTQDLGPVGVTGSAAYGNGVFTVAGAGADIQSTGDVFRYVYGSASGNCTITARVPSLQNVNPWSKAGVMIRASLATNVANAFIGVTPGNGVTWQYRSSAGGATTYNTTTGLSAPYWVRLVRSGSTFTGYVSLDGVTWTQQGTATFTMASTVYVGLALTSHDAANLATATFDNVLAPGWAASTPPPAPATLTATAWDSLVVLGWPASSGASSYNVKRATTTGGAYSIVSNVGTTNFTDSGLSDGANYYYVVSALNTAGESTNSVPAGATPLQLPQPGVAGISLIGGSLVFSGTNGLAGRAYSIWSSTNLAAPPARWTQVGGGSFDANGNFNITNMINPSETARYYLLSQP